MCCRFYVEPDTEENRALITALRQSPLSEKFIKAGNKIVTSGEIYPSNVVPVIATDKHGKKAVFPMKWGFQLPGGSLLVNARTETAGEKKTFKEAWEKHRCIIPASWYYEWEHILCDDGQKRAGNKYMIQPKGASMTWLAGLYRVEDGLPVFAVLTKAPAAELSRIHDRMPLIFPKELISDWISPAANPKNLLRYAVNDMAFERERKSFS